MTGHYRLQINVTLDSSLFDLFKKKFTRSLYIQPSLTAEFYINHDLQLNVLFHSFSGSHEISPGLSVFAA